MVFLAPNANQRAKHTVKAVRNLLISVPTLALWRAGDDRGEAR